MSWTVANNPLFLDLYRRHGRDWNFLGVIVLRTEWTTQHEKQMIANQTAKTAKMLGAQGAMVTWDAGGNEFIEVVRTIQACERLGIKTVFLTSEDDATEGAPTMLEPLPEADAIVSTSFFKNVTLRRGRPGPGEPRDRPRPEDESTRDGRRLHGGGRPAGADGGHLPRRGATTTTTASARCAASSGRGDEAEPRADGNVWKRTMNRNPHGDALDRMTR